MNTIDISELLSLINPTIIDIRANYYYQQQHIKNAISIPYYNLLNNHGHYLNKHTTYYLYCDTGIQSHEISTRLNKFGYHTKSIKGGYLEYLKYYDPK